ncbi:CLUMA_CG016870, isoform A [Clunio marinus]|uniref:CLUMA_CG016870, isoform A n=1 Tax=Clunio marinus TaxID=568069 RepID=A0A1J1IU88_9DIPT|nr:CLUMA_CG016870, isoform A [Clunio marinus]
MLGAIVKSVGHFYVCESVALCCALSLIHFRVFCDNIFDEKERREQKQLRSLDKFTRAESRRSKSTSTTTNTTTMIEKDENINEKSSKAN